ncbi:MAG TPA: hypothetical protein VHN77_02825 [Phycisphaerales bacterium]|nr:hypothetical protein [Phycisphaerales bacterium]
MCTLSIIALSSGGSAPGLRLVINRDESAVRAAALEPRWFDLSPVGHHAGASGGIGLGVARAGQHATKGIWPVDPVGGGTWVAANERGVAFAILNKNMDPKPELPSGLRSRGAIIPAIAHVASVRDGVDLVRAIDTQQFAPFRLVVSAAGAGVVRGVVCAWDRRELVIEEFAAPLCLASSGLGDHLVQVRLPLFDEIVRTAASAAAQDAFHGHSWADRPDRSVLMRRPGYRTVSVTTVEVVDGRVAMWYRAV